MVEGGRPLLGVRASAPEKDSFPLGRDGASRLSTYKLTRSGSLVAGISIAVAIETFAVHLVLTALHHPMIAWSLTTLSVLTVAWLIGEYAARRRGSASG